jgi:hypothetical protein
VDAAAADDDGAAWPGESGLSPGNLKKSIIPPVSPAPAFPFILGEHSILQKNVSISAFPSSEMFIAIIASSFWQVCRVFQHTIEKLFG